MAKRQLQKGKCRLCGQNKMLNFEHVPPRSTFNKTTRYKEMSFMDVMQNDQPFEKKVKGQPRQGGIGYYAYCENCNGYLGSKYVRSYKVWAEIGAHILGKGNFAAYEFEAYEQNPKEVLKQIISMFIAMNEYWFVAEYPELVTFVKDSDTQTLPSKFRIFTYLNEGPQFRQVPFMITSNLHSPQPILCCELAFPPFGYVLTIDHEGDFKYLAEITKFKNYESFAKAKLGLRLAKLPTILPIPLDYRSRSEIEENLRTNDSEQ